MHEDTLNNLRAEEVKLKAIIANNPPDSKKEYCEKELKKIRDTIEKAFPEKRKLREKQEADAKKAAAEAVKSKKLAEKSLGSDSKKSEPEKPETPTPS